ncbi:MAG: sugar phosphate isomerase/epimerase family protein [Novosphingobium sp.]
MSGAVKLAVSNIAWAPDEAEAACALLAAHGATGLEIAPGLAFADQDDRLRPSAGAIAALKQRLDHFGLALVSMQSLLFGVSGAQLFGSAEERERLEQGLYRAIDLAERLELPNLVFGSPGNRAYPGSMTEGEALDAAAHVFRRLGDRARAAGTRLAIEPNPAVYGTNFLTTVDDAARFVAALGHDGITLNYDIGALITNGEVPQAGALYDQAGARVSHVHISEPGLAAAPADSQGLASIVASLEQRGYAGWYSIEMRAPPTGALDQLKRSLASASAAFSEAMKGSGHA